MNLLNNLPFTPDEELRLFLQEYGETNGRMYQNNQKTDQYNDGKLPPMRPKYYGRRGSNILRNARCGQLLTQTKLAAIVGTTRKTISSIENHQREPSVYMALAIAQALQCYVEDVFQLPPLTPVPASIY